MVYVGTQLASAQVLSPSTCSNAAHCWVRNVRVTNSDYGILISSSDFCTVENVIIDTDYNRWGQQIEPVERRVWVGVAACVDYNRWGGAGRGNIWLLGVHGLCVMSVFVQVKVNDWW